MSFTAYATAVAGSVLAAAFWNSQVRDNGNVVITGINTADGSLVGPLKGYRETKQAGSISSNNVTVDGSLGNHVAVALTAAITSFTINNVPATGKFFGVMFYFTGDGTVRSITWAINTHTAKFPSNAPPVMTGTNAKVDEVMVYTYDGGTTWYAKALGFNL